jgi:hypothetical protein
MTVQIKGKQVVITGELATRILKRAATEKMTPDDFIIMCLSEYVAKNERIQEIEKDAK